MKGLKNEVKKKVKRRMKVDARRCKLKVESWKSEKKMEK
jgi:hypothetical protein